MTIIVPAEQAKKDYDLILKKMSKFVVIPGFRKGKAPLSMIERNYKDYAREEFFEKKLSEYYNDALKEKDVHPINEAKPIDIQWQKGNELKATFSFEVMPEIKIEKYKDLDITFQPIEFQDSMIEETMEKYQYELANWIDAETADTGDEIKAKFKFLDEEGNVSKTVQRTFFLGDNSYCDEFNKKLEKAKPKDEIKTILFDKEPESANNELGKDIVGREFLIEVETVKTMDLPEINDEFAKDLEYDNLEKLQKDIEQQIRSNIEKTNKENKKKAIFSKLIAENPFDLPKTIIENYANQKAKEIAPKYQIKPEEIIHLMKESAETDLKNFYVTQELIKQLAIKVEDQDREDVIKEAAANLKMDIDEYKKMYQSQINNENFDYAVQEKKLFDFLEKNNNFVKETKKDESEKDEEK